MFYKKKKENIKKIALERINQLFSFAERIFIDSEFEEISIEEKQNFANRYVELARKISMKANQPIPKEHKKKFCKHCHTYFRHGINVRVRLNQGKVVKYCLTCKKFSRFIIHTTKNKNEIIQEDIS